MARSVTSAGTFLFSGMGSVPMKAGKGAPAGQAAPEQISSPSAASRVASSSVVLPLGSAILTARSSCAFASARRSSGSATSLFCSCRCIASTSPKPPRPRTARSDAKSLPT